MLYTAFNNLYRRIERGIYFCSSPHICVFGSLRWFRTHALKSRIRNTEQITFMLLCWSTLMDCGTGACLSSSYPWEYKRLNSWNDRRIKDKLETIYQRINIWWFPFKHLSFLDNPYRSGLVFIVHTLPPPPKKNLSREIWNFLHKKQILQPPPPLYMSFIINTPALPWVGPTPWPVIAWWPSGASTSGPTDKYKVFHGVSLTQKYSFHFLPFWKVYNEVAEGGGGRNVKSQNWKNKKRHNPNIFTCDHFYSVSVGHFSSSS